MILTILFGVIGFGIMVFVHEFGHFLAAKRLGIEVEAFSLGWGKRLVGVQVQGHRLPPFDHPVRRLLQDEGRAADRPARGRTRSPGPPEPGSFFAASPWKRIVVAVSGPLANVLFAVLVLTAIWWIGFRVYSDDNRIVLATDYSLDSFATPPPATLAGLASGDRVAGHRRPAHPQLPGAAGDRGFLSGGRNWPSRWRGKGRAASCCCAPSWTSPAVSGRIGVYSWRDLEVAQGDARRRGRAGRPGPGGPDRFGIGGARPAPDRPDAAPGRKAGARPAGRPPRRSGAVPAAGPALLGAGRNGAGADLPPELLPFPKGRPAGGPAARPGGNLGYRGADREGHRLLFRGISVRNAVAGPLRIIQVTGAAATSGFSLELRPGAVLLFQASSACCRSFCS